MTPPQLAQITSLQNQRVKDVIKLNKRSVRDAQRLTLVEGAREVERALAAGIVPTQAFLCTPILQDAAPALLESLLASGLPLHQIHDTTAPVFAKLAYRGESGGVLLTIPYFARTLEQLSLSSNPLLLVIEGVEKPGNLGAILRTADAAGVDALIVVDGATDIHNPNTIRAALGASFTVPVATATTEQAFQFLTQRSIPAIATTPAAHAVYWDADMRGPVALLLGSEAHGLSQFWLEHAHTQIRLPMHGMVDSLNLSTATAIVLYEALRQRAR